MSESPAEPGRRIETVRRFFSPGERLQVPGLTGLRALAAFLVVGFHLNGLMVPRRLTLAGIDVTPLVTIGWVGVAVFFVLSGFLITVHLIERRASAGMLAIYPAYLRDRVLRVVPAYWAQIAILFVVGWIVRGTMPEWAPAIPAHLAFLQNFRMGTHSAINGVFWSLPVEFMFYLVAPFAVAAAWRPDAAFRATVVRALLVATTGIAIAIAWRDLSLRHWGADVATLFWASATHLPGNTDQFAIGMAAAMLFMAARPRATTGRLSDGLVVAGLAGLGASMYLLDVRVEDYWKDTLLFHGWLSFAATAIALLVAGVAARGRLARALFETRLVLWLGTISYSVYLWHWILGPPIAARLGSSGRLAFGVVALAAILVVAAASYYMVERPFLRMKRGGAGTARAIQ
jgi:peptidoglycan/LPS O-acetylase OafA/YrhL